MEANVFSLEYFLFAVKFSVLTTVIVWSSFALLRTIRLLLVDKYPKAAEKVDQFSMAVWGFIVLVSLPVVAVIDKLTGKNKE